MSYKVVLCNDPSTVVLATRRLSEAVAVALDDDARGILHRGTFVPFHNTSWQEAHPKIVVKPPKRKRAA